MNIYTRSTNSTNNNNKIQNKYQKKINNNFLKSFLGWRQKPSTSQKQIKKIMNWKQLLRYRKNIPNRSQPIFKWTRKPEGYGGSFGKNQKTKKKKKYFTLDFSNMALLSLLQFINKFKYEFISHHMKIESKFQFYGFPPKKVVNI